MTISREAGANWAPDGAMAGHKIPAITPGFWLAAILAAALGTTGGAALGSARMLGPLAGGYFSLPLFVLLASAQIATRRCHGGLYWTSVLASTIAATALADLAGPAHTLGAVLTGFVPLAGALSLGRLMPEETESPTAELLYWLALLAAQISGARLGAPGDLTMPMVAAAIAAMALLCALTRSVGAGLVWSGFVLARLVGVLPGLWLARLGLGLPLSSLVLLAAFALAAVLATRGARTY